MCNFQSSNYPDTSKSYTTKIVASYLDIYPINEDPLGCILLASSTELFDNAKESAMLLPIAIL